MSPTFSASIRRSTAKPGRSDVLAERLSAITHDLLAAADKHRRLIWTNPAWQPLLGWSANELASGSYHRLVHPDDLDRVRRAEHAVLAGRAGDRPETELRLRSRSGEYRWFVFSTSFSPAEERVFFSGKDITERKLGEEKLRAAEERFQAVAGSHRDAIVSADVEGRICFWNAGAGATFGLTAADAIGRPLTDLLAERHRAPIARLLAAGDDPSMETVSLEGLRADGSEFPLELSMGNWNESGQRHFTAVLCDMTEQVLARRALREAEQRFAGAFEGAAVGLMLAATDGTLLRANRALCELSGRAEEQLTGRRFDELLHPDEHGADDDALRAMLAGRAGPLAAERRFLTADGSIRIVRINVSLIRGSADEPLNFVGQFEDVTERRRTVEALTSSERLLEEHARELERSNAELEQFAFVASHDLSEPLRMIAGYVQLLRRRYHGKLDADADTVIEFAVDGADRMRRLIDDLLSYSHAGRIDEPLEPVDLQALAERTAEQLRSPVPPGVTISVGPLPTLPGNAQGLGQLFQNLIGNAVKFVPAGRPAQVEIGAERVGAVWRFVVTDNGIGLEPGHAEQIFSMFERLHSGDEYPGTGIGLAIAKKVVVRHGGTIWAESRAQGGSRFCFTLRAD